VAQAHLARVPSSGELEPAECIDGHGVGLDAVHVAQNDVGSAFAQHRADAFA
jgi:hypothetical protein